MNLNNLIKMLENCKEEFGGDTEIVSSFAESDENYYSIYRNFSHDLIANGTDKPTLVLISELK